ncbi:hypothetical protein G9A89_000218, partial [Geosiphon pyriformis]
HDQSSAEKGYSTELKKLLEKESRVPWKRVAQISVISTTWDTRMTFSDSANNNPCYPMKICHLYFKSPLTRLCPLRLASPVLNNKRFQSIDPSTSNALTRIVYNQNVAFVDQLEMSAMVNSRFASNAGGTQHPITSLSVVAHLALSKTLLSGLVGCHVISNPTKSSWMNDDVLTVELRGKKRTHHGSNKKELFEYIFVGHNAARHHQKGAIVAVGHPCPTGSRGSLVQGTVTVSLSRGSGFPMIFPDGNADSSNNCCQNKFSRRLSTASLLTHRCSPAARLNNRYTGALFHVIIVNVVALLIVDGAIVHWFVPNECDDRVKKANRTTDGPYGTAGRLACVDSRRARDYPYAYKSQSAGSTVVAVILETGMRRWEYRTHRGYPLCVTPTCHFTIHHYRHHTKTFRESSNTRTTARLRMADNGRNCDSDSDREMDLDDLPKNRLGALIEELTNHEDTMDEDTNHGGTNQEQDVGNWYYSILSRLKYRLSHWTKYIEDTSAAKAFPAAHEYFYSNDPPQDKDSVQYWIWGDDEDSLKSLHSQLKATVDLRESLREELDAMIPGDGGEPLQSLRQELKAMEDELGNLNRTLDASVPFHIPSMGSEPLPAAALEYLLNERQKNRDKEIGNLEARIKDRKALIKERETRIEKTMNEREGRIQERFARILAKHETIKNVLVGLSGKGNEGTGTAVRTATLNLKRFEKSATCQTSPVK